MTVKPIEKSAPEKKRPEKANGELYWKYHVVVTNDKARTAAAVMAWHLQHADIENAIKEHPNPRVRNG